ncbi:MAG: hypothetical protein GY909_19000 [Oligoflexia bacterium]|nr:hypothetical protein [Oligoflexia bacterium]
MSRNDHLEKLTDFYQGQLKKIEALTEDQLVSFFELSLYLKKEGAELSKTLYLLHQRISNFSRKQILKLSLLSHKDFSHYLNEDDLKLVANTFIGLNSEEAWTLLKEDWSDYGQVLFCCLLKDRKSAGFLLHKNGKNEWTREDGKTWKLPVLGKSSRDLEFFQTNGDTPTGFYTMDSVMPECDQPELFGKFHRVKIHFLADGKTQTLESNSICMKVHSQAQIASLFERSLLRIHGTGEINNDSKSEHFPHIKSAGCLTTRECEGFENDQEILLKVLQKKRVDDIDGLLIVMNILGQDEMEKLKDRL